MRYFVTPIISFWMYMRNKLTFSNILKYFYKLLYITLISRLTCKHKKSQAIARDFFI